MSFSSQRKKEFPSFLEENVWSDSGSAVEEITEAPKFETSSPLEPESPFKETTDTTVSNFPKRDIEVVQPVSPGWGSAEPFPSEDKYESVEERTETKNFPTLTPPNESKNESVEDRAAIKNLPILAAPDAPQSTASASEASSGGSKDNEFFDSNVEFSGFGDYSTADQDGFGNFEEFEKADNQESGFGDFEEFEKADNKESGFGDFEEFEKADNQESGFGDFSPIPKTETEGLTSSSAFVQSKNFSPPKSNKHLTSFELDLPTRLSTFLSEIWELPNASNIEQLKNEANALPSSIGPVSVLDETSRELQASLYKKSFTKPFSWKGSAMETQYLTSNGVSSRTQRRYKQNIVNTNVPKWSFTLRPFVKSSKSPPTNFTLHALDKPPKSIRSLSQDNSKKTSIEEFSIPVQNILKTLPTLNFSLPIPPVSSNPNSLDPFKDLTSIGKPVLSLPHSTSSASQGTVFNLLD